MVNKDEVEICKIDKSNWKKACLIEVNEEQKELVAPVSYCLARAYVNPYKKPIESYVVKYGNEIVGFYWTTRKNKIEIACGFRIDKQYQGKGIAKQALKKLINRANENCEIESIQVLVRNENEYSIKLVEACGFQKVKYFEDDKMWLYIFKKNEGDCELMNNSYLNYEES